MTKTQLDNWLSKYWHKLDDGQRVELSLFLEAMEA